MDSTLGASRPVTAAVTARPVVNTDEWLLEFIEMREKAQKNTGAKLSLKDVVARAENYEVKRDDLRPTSPNTIEAFMNLGIDLDEIRKTPIEAFAANEADAEIQQLLFEHYENVRQQKIAALEVERDHILSGDGHKTRPTSSAVTMGGDGEDQVERERKRLEVSRRRNMQQLEQMVNFEVARQQIQQRQAAKMKVLEAKIHEKDEEKKSREQERRMKQRALEIKRLEAERALEAEAERMAQRWYLQEQERLRLQREKEQRMKKEKELEEEQRKEKAERSRAETQRILEEQERAVEARRKEMEARDRLREKREEQKRKELAAANEEKRQRAEERRQRTLEQNEGKLRKRREEFKKKEEEAEARRRELEEVRLHEEELKRQREEERAREQQRKFLQAKQIEQDRINDILRKANEKEMMMERSRQAADKARTLKMVELKLKQNHKLEIVKEHERAMAWDKERTLHKIQDETERAFQIKAAKENIQLQRRMANLTASMQRHRIQMKMEEIAVKGVDLENKGAIESITQSVYS